jgi:hypothetical protein
MGSVNPRINRTMDAAEPNGWSADQPVRPPILAGQPIRPPGSSGDAGYDSSEGGNE